MSFSFTGILPFEVFSGNDLLSAVDARLTQAGISLLIICFLVALGFAALNRFENFAIDSKIYDLIVIALFIGAWPLLIDCIGSLVQFGNGILIRVFGLEEVRHFGDASSYLVGMCLSDRLPSGWVTTVLVKVVAFLFLIGKFFLEWVYLLLLLGFKLLGPLILGRAILAQDLSVVKALLAEVTILQLWQTTFVLLIGFVSLVGKGSL
ncbi:MAG: hypothetical protein COV44_02920 [Deltaproteobacteria bacterium CG11_big_fil_rev_8_21_14_0_20_45_16]|nr:MAG: hypothetical protein COV44_02920 [Deltaproteobacteria bacterium CG11_big_fil_rev_8_21_14_0_20_45_16]